MSDLKIDLANSSHQSVAQAGSSVDNKPQNGLMPRSHYFQKQKIPLDFTSERNPIDLTVISPDGKQVGYFLPHTKELKIVNVETNEMTRTFLLNIPQNHHTRNLTWMEDSKHIVFEQVHISSREEVISEYENQIDIVNETGDPIYPWSHESLHREKYEPIPLTPNSFRNKDSHIINIQGTTVTLLNLSTGITSNPYDTDKEKWAQLVQTSGNKIYLTFHSSHRSKITSVHSFDIKNPDDSGLVLDTTDQDILCNINTIILDKQQQPQAALSHDQIFKKSESGSWEEVFNFNGPEAKTLCEQYTNENPRSFCFYYTQYSKTVILSPDLSKAYTLRFLKENDHTSKSPVLIEIDLSTRNIRSLTTDIHHVVDLFTATEPPCYITDYEISRFHTLNADHEWLVTWLNKQDNSSRYEQSDIHRPYVLSANNHFLLSPTNNLKNLCSYSVINLSSKEVSPIKIFTELQDIRMHASEVQTKIFKARDGLDLISHITLPKNFNPEKSPFVVFPHGGPDAKDVHEYNPLTQFLANRGIGVIQVNYRGSNNSGREIHAAGNGHWQQQVEDIKDVMDKLVQEKRVNSDKIAVIGHSHGAYLTYCLLNKYPDLFKAGFAMAGVSDNTDEVYQKSWDFPILGYDAPPMDDIEARKQSDLTIQEVSPFFHFDKIPSTTPVMIVSGAEDTFVEYKHTAQTATELERLGKQVTEVKIKSEGHLLFEHKPQNAHAIAALIENFFGHVFHTEYETLEGALTSDFEVVRNKIPWLKI